MKRKHALVTGGAGFIGSHVVDALIKRGFDVTILDNLIEQVHNSDIKDDEGWPLYLHKDVCKIKGDILTPGCFEKAIDGVTHLVHLAASVGVGQSMSNIVSYTNNNTMSAAVMLEVISKGKHTIEKMVVASSMSIYGEGEYYSKKEECSVAPPIRDVHQLKEKKWELYKEEEELIPIATKEQKPLAPASIYAINKRDHEEMFLVMGRTLNIPTIALRLFNTYGTRQALTNPYTGVAAIFISRLINDLPPLIFEDGKQMRDFVHVSDVARTFLSVLESDQRLWDVFNVGSGKPIRIVKIAEMLARILKKNIKPEILSTYRIGDIRHCFADIGKIERTFDYKPEIEIEQGMGELVEWVKKCPKPLIRTDESMAELKKNKLII